MQVLEGLPIVRDANLLVGTATGDDAAIYRLHDDLALVLTVDFFPPIVDDPFDYGAIAAANSLSDVYAMGGRPMLALNLVSYPMELPKEPLKEILRGGYAKAQEAGCLIVGGHTVDDKEPKYGLAVVGQVKPGQQVTNAGARSGDVLVLTKPLGTGIITTAAKQDMTRPEVLQAAVETMSTLNRAACQAMMKVGPHACTDITGFGLLRHLHTMLHTSGVGARLNLASIPFLAGVRELAEQGIAPGGTHRNLKSVSKVISLQPEITQEDMILLCDAQTSGGLLISVAEEKAAQLLKELEDAGVQGARLIGNIVEGESGRIEVLP